jgi:hypothetical protein
MKLAPTIFTASMLAATPFGLAGSVRAASLGIGLTYPKKPAVA